MSELDKKVERIEKVLFLTWKLAKAVKRAHNRVTRIFNENFDVFDDNINRNTVNIDKIVKTLEELVGDAADYDKKHKDKKPTDADMDLEIRSLYL